jgi:membrane fusion protein, multidrug efflux system
MKARRIIITIIIVVILLTAFVARLISNKQYFNRQLAIAAGSETPVPVTVDTVKTGKIRASFYESGSFSAFKEVTVMSETQGQVLSVNAVTGSKVSQGDIIAAVKNDVLKSQLDLAGYNLEKAEMDMKRFETLTKGDAATPQQLESVRLALLNARAAYAVSKKQFDDTYIKASCNGYVSGRHIETGSFILPSQPVFDIVDLSSVKLIIKLTDYELEDVKTGDIVRVTADAFPSIQFSGRIISINPRGDLSKRFEAEIEVRNKPAEVIKPGMTGSSEFIKSRSDDVLTIPRKALAGSIIDPEVFTVEGNVARLKKIEAGLLDDHTLIVKNGLSEGEIIITSGQLNLVDGSKISINK